MAAYIYIYVSLLKAFFSLIKFIIIMIIKIIIMPGTSTQPCLRGRIQWYFGILARNFKFNLY